MFSTLPDLTPRDCHSLWYTSPRHPPLAPSAHHPSANYNDPTTLGSQQPPPQQPQNPRNKHSSSGPNSVIERSLLGRLRADESLIYRRQQHIANLGQSWFKPPGVPKTLFQIREEKREAEEHAEAVRREMAAQELAEAAERAQQEEQEQDDDLLPGEGEEEGMMVDLDGDIPDGSEMEMGEENLDDDIPEGDLDGDIPGGDLDDDIPEGDLDDDIPSGGRFGYDGASDEVDDDDDEGGTEAEQNNTFQTAQFDTSGDESSSIDPNDLSLTEVQQQRRIERRELQSRMVSIRAQEQRMRELMARGGQQSQPNNDDLYGGGDDDDNHHFHHDQHNMLEEEDLISTHQGVESGEDMDMDADLDDDIPEASGLSGVSAGFGMEGAGGGYEHTDSEAELSDDDHTQGNVSFAARGSVRGSVRRPQQQQQQNFRSSAVGQRQQQQNFRSSGGHFRSSGMGRGGGGNGGRFDPRSSLNHDISGFLSLDGSSIIGSSPHASFRRGRQG